MFAFGSEKSGRNRFVIRWGGIGHSLNRGLKGISGSRVQLQGTSSAEKRQRFAANIIV